ncbi:MAG: prolyl oligopeptidase family serine peptidase [Planctomycetota bacterium]
MNHRVRDITFWGWVLVMTFVHGTRSEAQSNYSLPPKEIVDIVDAPTDPALFWSSDTQWAVTADRDPMPDVADLARRMLALAGLRIDPVANGRFQTDYYRGLTLRDRDGAREVRIPTSLDAKIGSVSWSHRSTGFVYTVITESGTELWYVAIDQPNHPKRLTDRLSTVLQGLDWMPDGKRILCCVVPDGRGEEPRPPKVPAGPNIQESTGVKAPARTYQDLLSNAQDEALFDHYATTQLVLLDPEGPSRSIGNPDLIDGASVAPDGVHLLMTRLSKPFSYLLPSDYFPRTIDVVGLDGNTVYRVADVPLAENIPIEGVRTGPRSIQWWPGYPARLVWTEALDGGDPKNKVEHREQLSYLDAPFRNAATPLHRLHGRYGGLTFFSNPKLFITTESDRDRRWTTSLVHDLENKDPEIKNTAPRVFFDRSVRDRYADPGRVMVKPDANGFPIAKQNGEWIFLAGVGATPEGNRPFLDRRSMQSFEIERMWRCGGNVSENVVALVDVDGDHRSVITRRESVTEPPNYFLKDLASDRETQLTRFVDPTPTLRGIQKKIVKYQRSDGVPLSATLYLPADYVPGTRLPLIVWAYPLEFNDASTAGQISANPNAFTRIAGISHLSLLTQGYAIMDDATMPVIGDPETMNDTFLEQIVNSAAAAIDHAVELGVADRERVGVVGHSYGAFMTANLLAHSNLFKAGVARSGAYNRTLTPFGFQSERRPLWEAKDVYAKLSPFMSADKIKTPILFIHGENDNNSGTFPIQSQRMFQAVKGNGGITRLVMLPFESHGYRGRQSVLHTQAEMVAWFNRYVRDGKPEEPAQESGGN